MTTVKNFWIRPTELSINAREFSFGYTEQNKKEKRYKAEVKGDDLKSFHDFVFRIMAAKKKNQLPWPFVSSIKDKVKVTNPDDKEEQMEMELKANRIARKFTKDFFMKCSVAEAIKIMGINLRDSKYIRQEGKGKPGEKGYRPTLWYWITPGGKKKLIDQKTVAKSNPKYPSKDEVWKHVCTFLSWNLPPEKDHDKAIVETVWKFIAQRLEIQL